MSYLMDRKYPIKAETKWGGESSNVKDKLNSVGNLQKQTEHKNDDGKGLMQLCFFAVKAMIKINCLRTTSVEKTEVLLWPKSWTLLRQGTEPQKSKKTVSCFVHH